ncbi:hypothetical protein B484DRAFT_407448 [Ochromonadaceae sp. CCMP2298]|nr:hypothetical protein B484DRAFT_407448 [Ochromonadaceae sp. CCMP2298]
MSVVEGLKACRSKKHSLYALAGGLLTSVGEAVCGGVSGRLALLSVLTQHDGASFDALTGTKTVEGLLGGLDEEGVGAHMALLCGIIGASVLGSCVEGSPIR